MAFAAGALRTMAMMAVVPMVVPTTVSVMVSSRHEQRASVARATFLAPQVRGRRERLGEALLRPVREEDLRAPSLALIHDARVLELFHKSFLAPSTSG